MNDGLRLRLLFLAAADSVHSYRWIKFFADCGHEICWVSVSHYTGSRIPGVEHHDLPFDGPKALAILPQATAVRKVLHQFNPDIVHAHYAGTYGLLGALSGFHPFVLTAWGSDVLLAGPLKRPLVRWALRRADLVTCDAYHLRRAMVARGVEADKIELVIFGTEPELFTPRHRSESLRNSWGSNGELVVLSLRRLEPIYDIDTFVEAIPQILNACPETRFVVGGSGSQAGRLKTRTAEIGVTQRVFFPGALVSGGVAQALASADVYISTSLSDAGLSATTAEAMACGTPVIVTDSGENSLWIQDGENGFVIPVKRSDLLATRTVQLLRDHQLRKRVGAAGRETIVTKCNYGREMRKMGQLYEGLVKKDNATTAPA